MLGILMPDTVRIAAVLGACGPINYLLLLQVLILLMMKRVCHGLLCDFSSRCRVRSTITL